MREEEIFAAGAAEELYNNALVRQYYLGLAEKVFLGDRF
jgi:ABC-type lipopolysaccharide export system ATPase subunit